MKGFTQLSLAVLVTFASAVSVNLNKRESPLSVFLSSTGNTEVMVAVTNHGDKTLNLLSKGTFLDEELPVEKVSVFSKGGSNKVPFEGIKIRLLTSGLSPSDFMTLEAGMTKGVTVETAALHSLNEGGEFSVFAKGLLPYAEANSTELSGHIAYESNKLTISVDGKLAARVAKAAIKRSTVGGTCSGSKQSSVQTALSNCNKLASAASGAAQAGTKLSTYFKSSSSATKNTVANRLKAVAADCSNGKATTSNCNDEYNGCAANVLAYTQPSKNSVYYCEIFFSKLPALATTCHGQDQATTVLHEETHNPAVYAPGTDDIGYGYDAAIKLSTSQALSNADSYAIYANAINLNC